MSPGCTWGGTQKITQEAELGHSDPNMVLFFFCPLPTPLPEEQGEKDEMIGSKCKRTKHGVELFVLLVLSQKTEIRGSHPEVPTPLMDLLTHVWSVPTYNGSFWKEESPGEKWALSWVLLTYPGPLPVWVSWHPPPKTLQWVDQA